MHSVRYIAELIGIRQVSIFHFCKDFDIPLSQYSTAAELYSDTLLNDELAAFLLENKVFLRKYDKDYYADKTPLYMTNVVNVELSEIESFLKIKFPKYYSKGHFETTGPYSLRYCSTYKLHKEMGANYAHLTFPILKTHSTI